MELSWQRRIVSKVVSFCCLLKRKREVPATVNKILVVQWDYLGDMVVSTPALRALRDIFPMATINLLTSPQIKNYIEGCPFVNNIIYLQNPLHIGKNAFSFKKIFSVINIIRKQRYDLVVELSGRLLNQMFLLFITSRYAIGQNPTDDFIFLDISVCSKNGHQLIRNLEIINLLKEISLDDYSSLLYNPVTDEDRNFVENELKRRKITGDIVIIHAMSSWSPRQWSVLAWTEVIKYLAKERKTVCLIGTPDEFSKNEQIRDCASTENCFNLSGLFNIRQILALMEKSYFFIGSDSGPMHLAAIARLKGIILFGPGDPQRWGYSLHKVLYKKPSCGPCPQFAFRNKCMEGFEICKGLVDLKSEEVIERYKLMMNIG